MSSPALSSQKKGVQGLDHNTPVPALSPGKAVGRRAISDSAPEDKGTQLTVFTVDPLGSSSQWLSLERIQPHRSPGQVSTLHELQLAPGAPAQDPSCQCAAYRPLTLFWCLLCFSGGFQHHQRDPQIPRAPAAEPMVLHHVSGELAAKPSPLASCWPVSIDATLTAP